MSEKTETVHIDLAGKKIGVRIDPTETYSTHQLAIEFGVPEYAFRERVRDGRIIGKKVGKYFFVQGDKLIEFLQSGFSFSPRPKSRKNGTIESDIEKSRMREEERKNKIKKQDL